MFAATKVEGRNITQPRYSAKKLHACQLDLKGLIARLCLRQGYGFQHNKKQWIFNFSVKPLYKLKIGCSKPIKKTSGRREAESKSGKP